jgi:hypothetical protein
MVVCLAVVSAQHLIFGAGHRIEIQHLSHRGEVEVFHLNLVAVVLHICHTKHLAIPMGWDKHNPEWGQIYQSHRPTIIPHHLSKEIGICLRIHLHLVDPKVSVFKHESLEKQI